MSKIISFSVYGENPKYAAGSCKNAILSKHFYSDYKCVFYCAKDVPTYVIAYLKWAGAEIRMFDESLGIGGMFHRFLINDDPDCERYLIRDTDSRICEREVIAVREWEKSGAPFHVVRDHPHHNVSILGGVWGSTKGAVPNMLQLIKEWTGALDGYDADQQFLRHKVWPLVKANALQHDTCHRDKFRGTVPFPAPLSYDNPRFCCEVFDANDRPRSYDWEKMLMWVQPTDRMDKTEPLFIRPHLGLGDAFIINGMVRALAKKHASLIFPVKHRNLDTLKNLWSDVPNITLTPVDDDTEADTLAENYKGQKLMLGLFSGRWNGGQPGWDELMYKQAGVPFEERWEGFKIGRIPIHPHKFSAPRFALIHEDIDRGFVIPTNRKPDIPCFSVWPSGSLFDFVWMIKHAEEIHCIDSSVACLVDSIPTKAKKLVLHLYARPNAKPPTYKKDWIILKK
jgi:hypothetical protein